jgi:hypothetical protein
LRGFGDGHVFQIDQDECHSLRLGKSGQGSPDVEAGHGGGVLVPADRWFMSVQRYRRAGLAAPDPIERGVDHYPVQPGGHGCVAAVTGSPTEGRDQGVLQGVCGVLRVPGRPQSNRPQPVTMASHEYGERIRMAGEMVGEKAPVVRLAVTVHFSRTSETSTL